MTVKRNALGNVYELAWRHESARVRRAALYLLVKGRAEVELATKEDGEVLDALLDAGCDEDCEYRDGLHIYVLTCEGARSCYANGAFYEQE